VNTVVDIFTDGSCQPNPGDGGWAAVLRYAGQEREILGGARDSSNNRMEMQAAIEALLVLTRPCKVRLHTDSAYLQKGISEWLPKWQNRGWKTAAGAPVANQDLWQALVLAAAPHEIDWIWVRGHAGHADNERVDQLAKKARLNLQMDVT
jgi:ribonuclease HI